VITQFNQGQESNLSGQFLEDAILREFKARNVQVFDYDNNKHHNRDFVTECFVVRNAPYTSIYGCNSRSEFLYRDSRLVHDIRIECRWQQVAGSVDEKLPYLYMNAIHAMPEKEIWIVIAGDGARLEAVNWLKCECAKVAAKTIRVLSIPEARQRIKSLRI
jgi:hypothetical protein